MPTAWHGDKTPARSVPRCGMTPLNYLCLHVLSGKGYASPAMRLVLLVALLWASQALAAPVMVVPLEGAIARASADFVRRAIERAAAVGRQLVILRVDPPGGSDGSLRQCIKALSTCAGPV